MITIQEETVKNPISLIGKEAGVCWGADTTNEEKNYKRGLNCLKSNHGRTFEFPDVYMIIEGYSARTVRQWYTHIGGMPTRLQASTRYINYKDFDFVIPSSVKNSKQAEQVYKDTMQQISNAIETLEFLSIPKEDSALLLPMGMTTKIVCKHNARNLIDMSHQRKCTRAYWEYRELFKDLETALSNYSEEWAYLVKNYFKPKCEVLGFCPEEKGCGRFPKKNND